MKFKIIPVLISSFFTFFTIASHATELDNYLIQKQLIDQNYKIQDKNKLDEILAALSDEDSRVLPVQIDQNTVIEKIRLYHDHIDLEGIITSADFNQFSNSMGNEKTQQLLTQGLIENCHLIFENDFQRKNPYFVKMKLVSDQKVYHLQINNNQCKF